MMSANTIRSLCRDIIWRWRSAFSYKAARYLGLIVAVGVCLAAVQPDAIRHTAGVQAVIVKCPRGTSYPNDGCIGAQSSGSVYHADFFTRYTGMNMPYRPPWNVAGVDYPVGYAGALADPTAGGLPACASLSGTGSGPYSVTVSRSCTISGFDFSLYNGICVTISAASGSVSFANDKFGVGIYCNQNGGSMTHITGAAAVTFTYCEWQLSHSFTNPEAALVIDSTATVTVKYSAFKDPDQAGIEPDQPMMLNVSFNFVENIGAPPNHGDWVIGNNMSGTFTYNNDYNTLFEGSTTATTICYLTTANAGGTITGSCQHNVMVGSVGGPGGFLNFIGMPATIDTFDVSDNYFALLGSYGYYAKSGSGGSITGLTCHGNFDMTTGAAATGSLGPATCARR